VISNISPITLQAVFDKMNRVYAQTDLIYKPLPSVPNDQIQHEICIASISTQPDAPSKILLSLLPKNTKYIGLIALGGLAMPLTLEMRPKIEGGHWVVDQEVDQLRGDMSQLSSLNLPFLQLVANSDVILTKPGYGTCCEIAAIAKYKKVRVISFDRPETPFLNQFLAERVPFSAVKLKNLNGDGLAQIIKALLAQDYPHEKECEDGSQQLVKSLLAYLEN